MGLVSAPFFRLCLALACLALPQVARAKPKPRTLVIVDPSFTQAQAELDTQAQALARRLETLAGWKAGSLQARAFASIDEALPFVERSRPAFGLLTAEALVQVRKQAKLDVVGYAVGLEKSRYGYDLIARTSDNIGPLPHQQPGLRLATHVEDMQWLNVIFDGMLKPATHFKHVQVSSEQEAVEAVRAKKADVALVWRERMGPYKKLLGPGGGLRSSFHSAPFPPIGLVAFAKRASAKDTKALTKVLPEVCKGQDNLAMCGDLGFFVMEAGPHEVHPHLLYKYDNYK